MLSTKEPLIVIAGPTAVGKSDISLDLAEKIQGEIISADSIQVYRGMDIGSAKLPKSERRGIPHFLIDELDPCEDFNVALFQQKAKEYIKEIRSRNHIPIVVGGTGFYIQALLRDINFSEEDNDYSYRQELTQYAAEYGQDALYERLLSIDPKAAESIPAGNVKRVIRALEYFHLTGEKISVHNERELKKESIYNDCFFVLTDNRKRLYERINQRVDLMMEQGLYEEVKQLYQNGARPEWVSMQGIGYKQLLRTFTEHSDISQEIENIKLDTRHFAKRQLTWFRREKSCIWLDKELFMYDDNAILQKMIEYATQRGLRNE